MSAPPVHFRNSFTMSKEIWNFIPDVLLGNVSTSSVRKLRLTFLRPSGNVEVVLFAVKGDAEDLKNEEERKEAFLEIG